MKLPETRTVVFVRNLKACVEEMRKEEGQRYHIPKSRFGDDREVVWSATGERDDTRGKYYFRRFRTCLSSAWKASDRHYHIPKSRHGNVV